MSEPWNGPDDACPKCWSTDINPPDEGKWAECNDCGHVFYDAETIALRAEVEREYKQAKQECWPNPVPSYRDWVSGKRGEEL